MVAVKIKTTIDTNLDAMIKALEELDNVEVSAGYYDSKPHPIHDVTYPYIAFVNTYGAMGLPRRPFMQDATTLNIKTITKLSADAVVSALQVKPIQGDLNKVAKAQKKAIQDTIGNNNYQPNAEPYKSQKKAEYGNDDPLIASGNLRDNVDTRITKKGDN